MVYVFHVVDISLCRCFMIYFLETVRCGLEMFVLMSAAGGVP